MANPALARVGTLASVLGDSLRLSGNDGKRQIFMLSPNASIQIEGKSGKKEDLKAGMQVRIIADPQEPNLAVRVEVLGKPNDRHDQ